MSKNSFPDRESAYLDQLARVPENRRRELLKLMLAGSVTGVAEAALPGCGGGGNGGGAAAFPFPATGTVSTPATGSPASAPPPAAP